MDYEKDSYLIRDPTRRFCQLEAMTLATRYNLSPIELNTGTTKAQLGFDKETGGIPCIVHDVSGGALVGYHELHHRNRF